MKIIVVGLPPEPIHAFETAEEMIAAAPKLGWTLLGSEDAPHLRHHLLGLPKFNELCGPMGEGSDGQVRYETWPANEFYSS
ncbi:MAG: hypothetical protein EOO81_11680 [Oxalobacteraceae bacterium]|nr:MAG: hypothetical protein EOO81_11680 [Oxalobacteraceae bacterium]